MNYKKFNKLFKILFSKELLSGLSSGIAATTEHLPILKSIGNIKTVEKYLVSKSKNIQGVEIIGPVYNEEKKQFFSDIDLLILPSINEAEPLVIYEAFSYGIPVVAFGVGCIQE